MHVKESGQASTVRLDASGHLRKASPDCRKFVRSSLTHSRSNRQVCRLQENLFLTSYRSSIKSVKISSNREFLMRSYPMIHIREMTHSQVTSYNDAYIMTL